MNRIVLSNEINPYYNLALEEELLKNIEDNERIFYLWQNEKTVVIGRNQNPYLECNIDYMNENKIFLVRRISGGGAVFHDLGNLNFTFIAKEKDLNLEKELLVIKKALEKFNLNIEFSGRNDLILDGKKFSGEAFYGEDGNGFHHGTLMVDVDVDSLSHVLNPSKLKLKGKGIKSVKSRVINLKEANPSINIENLKDALERGFKEVYGEDIVKEVYSKKNYIPKLYEKYNNSLWNFGESPKFNVILEEKLNIGNVFINLDVEDGIISKANISSDTLLNINFKNIEDDLISKEFSKDIILEYVKKMVS